MNQFDAKDITVRMIMRWLAVIGFVISVALAIARLRIEQRQPASEPNYQKFLLSPQIPQIPTADRTDAVGIDAVRDNGATGEKTPAGSPGWP